MPKAKAALPIAHQTTDNYADYYNAQNQCKLALDGLFNSGTVKGIRIKTVTDLPASSHYALYAMFDGFLTVRGGRLVLRIPSVQDVPDGPAEQLRSLEWKGPQVRHITYEPSATDLARTRAVIQKKLETLEIDNKTAIRSKPDKTASAIATTTVTTSGEIQTPDASNLAGLKATQNGNLITVEAQSDSDKKWVRAKLADGKMGYVSLAASRISCARYSRVATTNESKGKVDVTNTSATVKGSSDVNWTAADAGRRIRVEGHSVDYKVHSVDTTKRELTLTAPYLGATAAGVSYTMYAMEPSSEKSDEKDSKKIVENIPKNIDKNFEKNSRTLTEHVLIEGVDAALDLLMSGRIECFVHAGDVIGSIEGDKRVEIVIIDSAGQQPLDFRRIDPREATGRPFSPLFLLYNLLRAENKTRIDMLTSRPATVSSAKPDHPLIHLLKTGGGTSDQNLILDLGRSHPPAPLRLTHSITRGGAAGTALDIGPLSAWHKTLSSRLSAYLFLGRGNAATNWRIYGAEANDTQTDQIGVMKANVEPGRTGDVPSWFTYDAATRLSTCYDSEPTNENGAKRYETFWDKYATFINKCATVFQLPCELILAISAVEAGGQMEENNTRTEPLGFNPTKGKVKFSSTIDVKEIEFSVEASSLPQSALSGTGAIATSIFVRPIKLELVAGKIKDKANLKVVLLKPGGTPALSTTFDAMANGSVTHELPIADVSLSGKWKWRLTYKKVDAEVSYELYSRNFTADFPSADAATRQKISVYEHLLGKANGNNVQIEQTWNAAGHVRTVSGTALDQRTTGFFTWGDLVDLGTAGHANFSWSLMQTTLKPAWDKLQWAKKIYGDTLFDDWSFNVTHGAHSTTLKVAAIPAAIADFFKDWAACTVSGTGDDAYFTNLRRALHTYILGSLFLKYNSSIAGTETNRDIGIRTAIEINIITDFDPPTAAATYNAGTHGSLFQGKSSGGSKWQNVWAMRTFNDHYPQTLPAQYNAAVRRFNGTKPPTVAPALTLWK